MLRELILPRTDAGVLIQLLVTLVIGVPIVVSLARRRETELVWFVGGALVLLLGVFAVRSVH